MKTASLIIAACRKNRYLAKKVAKGLADLRCIKCGKFVQEDCTTSKDRCYLEFLKGE